MLLLPINFRPGPISHPIDTRRPQSAGTTVENVAATEPTVDTCITTGIHPLLRLLHHLHLQCHPRHHPLHALPTSIAKLIQLCPLLHPLPLHHLQRHPLHHPLYLQRHPPPHPLRTWLTRIVHLPPLARGMGHPLRVIWLGRLLQQLLPALLPMPLSISLWPSPLPPSLPLPLTLPLSLILLPLTPLHLLLPPPPLLFLALPSLLFLLPLPLTPLESTPNLLRRLWTCNLPPLLPLLLVPLAHPLPVLTLKLLRSLWKWLPKTLRWRRLLCTFLIRSQLLHLTHPIHPTLLLNPLPHEWVPPGLPPPITGYTERMMIKMGIKVVGAKGNTEF
jgi:hypothetical protein